MSDVSSFPCIDPKTFWSTLGQRVTGVTIVTASGPEGPAGFLGLSATHVTADPPTLLVSIDRKTTALGAVLASRHFAVNYLPAEANAVSDAFAGKRGLQGADRFAAGDWTTLKTGAPIFGNALGAFDCVVEDVIERGSIAIAIGSVVAAMTNPEMRPLVFFRGSISGSIPA